MTDETTWEATVLRYDNGWGVGVDDGSRYYTLTRPADTYLTEAEATSIAAQLNAGAQAMQAPEPAPVPRRLVDAVAAYTQAKRTAGIIADKAETEAMWEVVEAALAAVHDSPTGGAQAPVAPAPNSLPSEVHVFTIGATSHVSVHADRDEAHAAYTAAHGGTKGCFYGVPVHGASTPDPLPEGVVRGLVLPAGVEPPKGIEAMFEEGYGWYLPTGAVEVDRVVRLAEPPAPTYDRVPWWEAVKDKRKILANNKAWITCDAVRWVDNRLLIGATGVGWTAPDPDGMVSVLPLEGEA